MWTVVFLTVLLLAVGVYLGCSSGGGSTPDPDPNPDQITVTISGVITNSTTSQPVSGASISTTPATQTVSSGTDGSYTISNVVAGTYTITVTITGYQTYTANITVQEGVNLVTNITLTQQAVEETGNPAYQTGTWVATGGPFGGLGYDIRMSPDDPDTMYVTDDGAGAFKSTNGGQTWFSINSGITPTGSSGDNYSVFCLNIDPNDNDRIWVGSSQDSNIFLSTNRGQSWTLKKNGITEQMVTWRGVAVEPGNSNVVYVGGEVASLEWNNGDEQGGLSFDKVKGVVYKTTDGGDNWTRVWSGDNLARYILIDPDDTNRVFVSTGIFDREPANSDPDNSQPGGVGVLRSLDAGQTWEELDESNGFDPNELWVGSLFMHPTNSDILLAGTDSAPYENVFNEPTGGVYRTSDGGTTWTEVLDKTSTSVEICEGDPNVAYATTGGGFYKSTDAGVTWTQMVEEWGPSGIIVGIPIDMQCDPRDSTRIFVNGYGGGNFLSTDSGVTWTTASSGYTGARMADVNVAPDNPGLVYGSGRSGVFKSNDGGTTWTGLAYGEAHILERGALAVDPTDSQHVFLMGSGLESAVETTDGGMDWQKVDLLGTEELEDDSLMVVDLHYSPHDSNTILGVRTNSGCWLPGEIHSCLSGDGGGIIISTDGGTTWSSSGMTSGNAVSVAFAGDDENLVYATVYDQGIYRSTDGGATWTQVNVNPRNRETVEWQRAFIAVDPTDSQRLYAGFFQDGVYLSTDGGTTWAASSAGMNAETDISHIVVDDESGTIYASSTNAGVYYSIDQGQQWVAVNSGLANKDVVKLSLSTKGTVLYAATRGGGVFRLGIVGTSQ